MPVVFFSSHNNPDTKFSADKLCLSCNSKRYTHTHKPDWLFLLLPPVAVFLCLVDGVGHIYMLGLLVDTVHGFEYVGGVPQSVVCQICQLLFECSVQVAVSPPYLLEVLQTTVYSVVDRHLHVMNLQMPAESINFSNFLKQSATKESTVAVRGKGLINLKYRSEKSTLSSIRAQFSCQTKVNGFIISKKHHLFILILFIYFILFF